MARGYTFEPTEEHREIVIAVASHGIPHDAIAQLIKGEDGKPISERTLERHFKHELAHGHEVANARVRRTLFEMATSGKVVAATIFWAKTQLGYKEPAQDVNIHQTYGELVERATAMREDKPALAVITGGKA